MRSIRIRLIVSMFSLIVALTIALSAILIRQTASSVVDSQEASLHRTATMMANRVAPDLAAGDRIAVLDHLAAIEALDDVVSARVSHAEDGIVALIGAAATDFSGTEPAGGVWSRVVGPATLRIFMADTLSATVVIGAAPDELGTLTLFAATAGIRNEMLRLIALAVAAGVMTGIVAIVAVMALQAMITRPLHQLMVAMDIAGRTGRYSETIDESGPDETAVIARTFNAMITRIGVRDQALKDRKADLESKVMKRTRDLELAKDSAESANRAKSVFLATMSHEIRTPLNGMMVMAELLAGSDLDPKRKRYAELIESSGRTLVNIINDVLDLSKIEAGALTLEPMAVDPCRAVADVVDIFAEKAASKGLDLAGYVDPEIPEAIRTDPVRLRQILSNFISNAIKFTASGYVYVELARDGDRLCLTVRDTGIGIRPESLERIFEPFAQEDTSTVREFGGTGLGLSICKRLAGALGGRIGCQSEPGRGSVFFVDLPLVPAETAGEPDRTGHAVLAGKSLAVLTGERVSMNVLAQTLDDAGLSVRSIDEASVDAAGLASEALIIATPEDMTALIERLSPEEAHDLRSALVCAAPPSSTRREWLRDNGYVGHTLDVPASRDALLADLAVIVDPETGRTAETFRPVAGHRAPGVRALVVDDNAVNREVMAAILDQFCVEAVFAVDGAEAVEIFRTGSFDVVFMDISMPVMDGVAAATRMRAIEKQRGAAPCPMVALTAHEARMDNRSWEERGFDAYIGKPVRVSDIDDTLTSLDLETGCASAERDDEADADERLTDPNALIDWSTIEGLTRTLDPVQRENLLDTVLAIYCMDAPGQMTALKTAIEAADVDEISMASHALKSVSLNVGASRVARIAGGIEFDARSGRAEVDPAVLADLAHALDVTMDEFNRRQKEVA